MSTTLLNSSAELLLDNNTRIEYILVNTDEPITLADICIDKGDGWMPYNGTIQINGIVAPFPATLKAGDNFVKLDDPFYGIGVYLKGYDFLSTNNMDIVDGAPATLIGGDNSRSGELIITSAGIAIINFADLKTTNYNVVALITTTDGSIGIANVLFNTRTNTSVQVQAYEAGVMRYVITAYQ